MARKKPQDSGGAGGGWISTFADLMNLLLCFFVLLFASSSVDQAKFDEIAASFTSTFSIFQAGSTAIGDGILISNGVSQLNELSEYINSTGAMAENNQSADEFDDQQADQQSNAQYELQTELENVEAAKLEMSEELSEKIEEALEENNISDKVEIDFNSQYVQLTLKGAILFNSGSADLTDSIIPTLQKVGIILEKYAEYEVEIEGHTDNVPEHSKRFASNDELSSARALSVFNFLVDNTNLSPANIKHAGCGEYRPIADNSTSEGRDQNRRVEIKIYHELSKY